jgi:hypothetical protein
MTSISISITTYGATRLTASELWAALPRPRLSAAQASLPTSTTTSTPERNAAA